MSIEFPTANIYNYVGKFANEQLKKRGLENMKKGFSVWLALILVVSCLIGSVSATGNSFTDVKAGDYFYHPVYWAVEKGITAGVGDNRFGPSDPCTREQVVTFLWHAAGDPAPSSSKNPFTDVTSEDYFYTAVLWAVGNGITAGVSADRFGSGEICTRGQIVTFLWKFKNMPTPNSGSVRFSDVDASAYYATAVAWAVENGVTAGVGNGKFGPNQTCTRGQVMTFLYKAAGGYPVVPDPSEDPETGWGTRIYEFEEVGSDPLESYVEIGIYAHYDRYGNVWYDRSPTSNGYGKSIYQSFFFNLTPAYFGEGRWGNRNNYWSKDGECSNNEWQMHNGFSYPWVGAEGKRIPSPCPYDNGLGNYFVAATKYYQMGPGSREQCKIMYGLTDEMADIIDNQGVEALPIPSMGMQAPQGPR